MPWPAPSYNRAENSNHVFRKRKKTVTSRPRGPVLVVKKEYYWKRNLRSAVPGLYLAFLSQRVFVKYSLSQQLNYERGSYYQSVYNSSSFGLWGGRIKKVTAACVTH